MIKQVLKNFLKFASLKFFIGIYPLLLIPFIVRIIGMDDYGVYAMLHSGVIWSIIFIKFGFGLSASKLISTNRNNVEACSKIFSYVILLSSILIFLMSAILFIYYEIIGLEDLVINFNLIFLFVFLYLFFEGLSIEWYFVGVEKFNTSLLARFIGQTFYALIILFFINKDNGVMIISFALMMSSLISTSIINSVGFFKYKIKLTFNSYKDIKYMKHFYIESLTIFSSIVSTNLYKSSGIVFLSIFSSPTNVGIYNAIEKLYSGIYQILQALFYVLFPAINKLKSEDEGEAKRKIYIFLLIGILIAVPFSIMFIFFNELLSTLFINLYSNDIRIIFILFGLILTITVFSNILGIQGLVSFNMSSLYAKIIFYVSLAHIIFLYFAVNYYSLIGVVAVLFISELLISLITYYFYTKKIGFNNL